MNNPQDSNESPEAQFSPSVPYDDPVNAGYAWNGGFDQSLGEWILLIHQYIETKPPQRQPELRTIAKRMVKSVLADKRYAMYHRAQLARFVYFTTSIMPEDELLTLLRELHIRAQPDVGRNNKDTGETEFILRPIEEDSIVRCVGSLYTNALCPDCNKRYVKYFWSREELEVVINNIAPDGQAFIVACDNCANRGYNMDSTDAEYLRSLPYDVYLQTSHWKDTRAKAIERADHRCQLCNAKDTLHVHHRTYKRRGCEDLNDLTVLCASCHKTFHDNHKVVKD